VNDPKQLSEAILATHGLHAVHLRSVPVKETFRGETVWEGVVEVFRVDSEETDTCYAWSFPVDGESGQMECVAVLKLAPVVDPSTAISAFLRTVKGTPPVQ